MARCWGLPPADLPVLPFEQGVLYHGTNSPAIVGSLRANENDFGWFGRGFYLTVYPEYAAGWGKNVFQMAIPSGKYARVRTDYHTSEYDEDAAKAHAAAGGNIGWITDPHLYAHQFARYLKERGFAGVRVTIKDYKDAEVVVFDPSQIRVLERVT